MEEREIAQEQLDVKCGVSFVMPTIIYIRSSSLQREGRVVVE
jgi:hypothetical protein